MKYESNPPDAASLMMSARSFGNYDLPAALADLIDNSIKAGAREIALTCRYGDGDPEIRVRDDGHGLSGRELRDAMRPASSNPLAERSPDDLGRFGWGMKSASFSQCARLTVLSRRDGELTGCVWDLSDVEAWRMGVLEPEEIVAFASPELIAKDGVEVVWSHCDRLSENNTLTQAEFNALIVHAGNRLAFVFHRYLAGEVRGKRLTIRLNNRKLEALDLSRVFVQMKLSVVNPDRLEAVVPLISRYANTQNKISEADFFSSHPIHLVLERMSRSQSAPPKPGALSGSKWFYERARGQYRDRLAYGTQAERKRFELEFPRDQFIEKTDLAKFEVTFECRPHIVSRGAQKCFLDYAEKAGKAWEVSEARFNDRWFRSVVAEAIVFRSVDRQVGRSEWYQTDRGYKAQIVTYTVAWLVNHLRGRGLELDLDLIWQRQELPVEIADVFAELAPQIAETIKDAPPAMKNVGEYCKQQACWAVVAASSYAFKDRLDGLVIDHDQAEEVRKAAVAARKVDQDIDFDLVVVAILADTQPYLSFARSHRLLTPKSDAALSRLTRGDIRLPASERNALKYMVEKMVQAGFEMPDAPQRSSQNRRQAEP